MHVMLLHHLRTEEPVYIVPGPGMCFGPYQDGSVLWFEGGGAGQTPFKIKETPAEILRIFSHMV